MPFIHTPQKSLFAKRCGTFWEPDPGGGVRIIISKGCAYHGSHSRFNVWSDHAPHARMTPPSYMSYSVMHHHERHGLNKGVGVNFHKLGVDDMLPPFWCGVDTPTCGPSMQGVSGPHPCWYERSVSCTVMHPMD